MASYFLFQGFRRNLVAGAENNQILDPPHNPPVPRSIHLALIAGMKPSVAQHFGGLGRSIPVARKHVWAPHDDLIVVAELHLNAGNRWSDTSWHDMAGIVHRTNSSGLGEPVNLQ